MDSEMIEMNIENFSQKILLGKEYEELREALQLLENKEYHSLYERYNDIINEMLLVYSYKEFLDFLNEQMLNRSLFIFGFLIKRRNV